jgi:hypothetical protein
MELEQELVAGFVEQVVVVLLTEAHILFVQFHNHAELLVGHMQLYCYSQ